MSDFDVPIVDVHKVIEHPNADRLELIRLLHNKGPLVVAEKGRWEEGEVGVYVPVDALLPQWLLEQLGLEGKLAGKQKNRVKTVKLRGVPSSGLLLKPDEVGVEGYPLGTDVHALLGIEKYSPPVPPKLSGTVLSRPSWMKKYEKPVHYWKYGDSLDDNEEVVVLEKIHGSNMSIGAYDGEVFVSSANQVLKKNEDNLFWKACLSYGLEEKMRNLADLVGAPLILYGELFGPVQDLKYGAKGDDVFFRVFDLYANRNAVPELSNGPKHGFLTYDDLKEIVTNNLDVPLTPLLSRGLFGDLNIPELAEGNTEIPGADHIREGVVVRPTRNIPFLEENKERLQLKHHSETYKLRQGGTEYH